jgi:hypothetical protein
MTNNAISFSLRQLVIERAQGRCEYCLIHQDFSIYTHEIDHIIAVKHGGQTLSENLALSCLPCNRHKGSDFATLDPSNGEIIRLFHPRLQIWNEHFTLKNAEIIGNTAIGQATSRLLMFNTSSRVRSRKLLIAQNLYP